ncbi:MAG: signal peptide peptidase SppA [Bacteroidetes bacterium]|nr:MAG: signal peptide peptidase SppA [Bacteroidota bacterium]
MKSFLKYTLATITGIIISVFVLTILMFGIFGAIISSTDKPASIKDNSILQLKINQNIPDRSPENPFDFDFISKTFRTKTGLNDILKNLDKAKTDPKIKGVFLDIGAATPGIATQEEIREALEDFKSSGKFIIAYANAFLPQTSYYLATIADSVFCNPVAYFDFRGLRSETMYYKGALDKIGVEMQIIRHGKFKSAVEPYFRKDMSEESREQIMVYLESIWNKILTDISASRNISIGTLNEIADGLIQNPEDALEAGMIDGLMYQDEINTLLREKSGISQNKKIRFVSSSEYAKVPAKHSSSKKGLAKSKIAVIYASGIIGIDRGVENSIGGPRFVKAIRNARKDSNIKAIVLRVNSPGGSAMISEHIWREVDLARKDKPVIGSMGNLAASGGYYILAPADTIIAHPVTLTGSIGVFGTIPNAEKLLNDKLGLTFDVAKTNENSDFGSLHRPLRPHEKAYLQAGVEKTYQDFINHVSEGRNIPLSTVDSIGQGRVWSGVSALENGLIDSFGGLTKAISIAAEMAKLDHYRIVEYPKLEDPLEMIMKNLYLEMQIPNLKKELGTYYPIYESLLELTSSYKIQARLPFHLEVY